MHAVIVYGTLLVPAIRARVVGRELRGRAARVVGFERFRVRGELYPTLVPREGAVTAGEILEGVDDVALARLDAYEGAEYERVRVVAESERGPCEASLWLLRPEWRHRASEEPWDLDVFVARDLERYLGSYAGFRAEPPLPPTP